MDPTQSTLPPPFRCMRHNRFSKEQGWRLSDISLSSTGHIAVAGSNNNTDRTSMDLYSDSREKPKLFYSREYEKYSTQSYAFCGRLVSFMEDYDKIVTCVLDNLEIIELKGELVLNSRKVTSKVECLAARRHKIYTAFWRSKEVNIYDEYLNAIKTISMEGMHDGDYAYDLAATSEGLFVCTFSWPAKARSFDKESGKILCEFKNETRKASNANSITVSLVLGLLSVLWDWNQILFYALSDNTCILVFECGSSRIRISGRGSFVTGSRSSCEVKMYDMAELFTYTHFKEKLVSLLQKDDCLKLIEYFAVLREQSNALTESSTPATVLLLALEEKGIIDTSNIDRLTDAFARLNIGSPCHHMAEIYNKTRMQATFYGTFLATLSAHLTKSVPNDLCKIFNISEETRQNIISNRDPGLSLLLTLDEMDVISSSDVDALIQPFIKFRLLQALAKVREYQSDIEDENAQLRKGNILTMEEKRDFFIRCIQKKIQNWYEGMTPVPWKKSCNWRAADLFVGSGLILTRSNSKHSSKDIDEKCKLHYTEILTHESLTSELRIILEGDPGSGKTMLMSQLAYDWSQGKFSEIKVLIFLPLKFVKNKTLVQAIKEFYFQRQDSFSVTDIELFLVQEAMSTYLLLDGLEEYNPRLNRGGLSEVMKVMSKVTYKTCKVIVTSRSDHVQDLPQCPMLRLGRFAQTERDCYLAKVYSDNMVEQLKVKEVIENTPFVLDLCSVPLLFVLAVHNIDSMEKLDKRHLDKVAPFMSNMVNTLCPTSAFIDTALALEPQIENYIQGRSFLERCAFNGLCRGQQQLSWPKKFIDINVFKSKQWIDSGIFVVEEGLVTADNRDKPNMSKPADRRKFPTEAKFETIDTDSPLYESNARERDTEQFGIPKNASKSEDIVKLHSTAGLGSTTLSAPVTDDSVSQNATQLVDSSDSTAKHFPLHIKFLHKIIQEWFAAQHFSFQIIQLKQPHLQESFLNEHLPFISPTDLHYVLRFTCALYPPCFHLIITHLLKCHCSRDGGVPNYILNCIFLCFAEYDGPITHGVLKAVAELCKHEITIHSEDSRLLQQAKVSVLELASEYKVPTKKLLLTDIVESVSGDTLRFNSGITLAVLNTLELIDISRWDQSLEGRDHANIVKFISKYVSLKALRLHFPDQPPEINKETRSILQCNQTTVTWIIGKKLRLVLDTETGLWTMVEDEAPQLKTEPHSIHGNVDTTFSIMEVISNKGGTMRIPNTNVQLQISPEALPEEMNKCEIYLKIIVNSYEEKPPSSFGSDSSVVVEILPNHLHLRRPALLTLPHCLQLKNTTGNNVTVFISHHDKGRSVKWERTDLPYQLNEESCTIHLRTFCWVKYNINDKIVEAKKIQVYTARRKLLPDDGVTKVDVGYYYSLSGTKEILQMNKDSIVEEERPFLFFKEGRNPLSITFSKCLPEKWRYCSPEENRKIIPFNSVESSVEGSCPFIFEKTAEGECFCTFKVSQTNDNIELTIPLKVEKTVDSLVHSLNSEKLLQPLAHIQLSSNSAVTQNARVPPKPQWATQNERGDNTTRNFLSFDQHEEPSLCAIYSQGTTYQEHPMFPNREPHRSERYDSSMARFYSGNYNSKIYPFSVQSGVNTPHWLPEDHADSRWWLQLRYGIIKELAKSLDLNDPLGNDWRQLADELGFTMGDIDTFENAPSATFCVIGCAVKSGKLKSQQQLKAILEKIGRIDAASIIPNEDSERLKSLSDSEHSHQVTSATKPKQSRTPDLNQFKLKTNSQTVISSGDNKSHDELGSWKFESTPITDLETKTTEWKDSRLDNEPTLDDNETRRSHSSSDARKSKDMQQRDQTRSKGLLQIQKQNRYPDDLLDVTFQFLLPKLGPEWQDVGRFLGLLDRELSCIERDNQNSLRETIYQMFLYWKQQNGSEAKYTVLIKALKRAGRKDLAEAVQNREDIELTKRREPSSNIY